MEVKINPTFIPPGVDCFNIGVQENKKIFKQAIAIPSINPTQRTSILLNSFMAFFN